MALPTGTVGFVCAEPEVAVPFADDFTLFGDAYAAADTPWWLGQYRPVGRATATGNGSPPAMKQGEGLSLIHI